MTAAPEETWELWTARIATDLGERAWMTFAVHVDSSAAVAEAAATARKGWKRVLAPPPPPPRVPDVFLQARLVEGVIALECIGDTEFEGLTDLTKDQQATLLTLGWEQDGTDPEFDATFAPAEAADAAELLAATLRGVLGASSPSVVDIRHSS